MSWRDNLSPGSFRDAWFECESSGATLGRRTALHEFPGRDDPEVEDLGRAARQFTLELYVLGPQYMAARDALLEALDMEGPGRLVHPWLGEMDATPTAVSLRESTREGGMARLTVTFIQAPKKAETVWVVDTTEGLTAGADALETSALADFQAGFNALNNAAHVVEQAIADVEAALGAVEGLVQSITAPLATLIRTPANLAAALQGSISRIRALANDPRQALAGLRALFGTEATLAVLPETTTARKLAAANRLAIFGLVADLALAESARAVADTTFPSATDALAARDALLDTLDARAETALDATYDALATLRSALVRDAAARGANLARVVAYTPGNTLPALVIAHALYGDASREAEIIARNNLPHPVFVQGGEPLEVLTNG